jgi:hypothetical protein
LERNKNVVKADMAVCIRLLCLDAPPIRELSELAVESANFMLRGDYASLAGNADRLVEETLGLCRSTNYGYAVAAQMQNIITVFGAGYVQRSNIQLHPEAYPGTFIGMKTGTVLNFVAMLAVIACAIRDYRPFLDLLNTGVSLKERRKMSDQELKKIISKEVRNA